MGDRHVYRKMKKLFKTAEREYDLYGDIYGEYGVPQAMKAEDRWNPPLWEEPAGADEDGNVEPDKDEKTPHVSKYTGRVLEEDEMDQPYMPFGASAHEDMSDQKSATDAQKTADANAFGASSDDGPPPLEGDDDGPPPQEGDDTKGAS